MRSITFNVFTLRWWSARSCVSWTNGLKVQSDNQTQAQCNMLQMQFLFSRHPWHHPLLFKLSQRYNHALFIYIIIENDLTLNLNGLCVDGTSQQLKFGISV